MIFAPVPARRQKVGCLSICAVKNREFVDAYFVVIFSRSDGEGRSQSDSNMAYKGEE
jgi:hypothetical protein